jgi:hypothetical protein
MAQWSGFLRQNIIGTLVGFNPRTVQKHTITAAINSMTEVGLKEFGEAFASIWRTDPARAQNNWAFAMERSEELQRRHQSYIEHVKGAQEYALTSAATQSAISGGVNLSNLRQTMQFYGTKPVAFMDLASAVPTWLAQYKTEIAAGRSEGDAIYAADRAVRRMDQLQLLLVLNLCAVGKRSNGWLPFTASSTISLIVNMSLLGRRRKQQGWQKPVIRLGH